MDKTEVLSRTQTCEGGRGKDRTTQFGGRRETLQSY